MLGVSLTVAPGSIVTVIGANGAGKTTLLNAIMGVLPSRGAIPSTARRSTPTTIEERVAAGLCLVPERRELFANHDASRTISCSAAFRAPRARACGRDLASGLRRFPRLHERATQLAGTLSGGERQMLAIGRALMARPRLLMLDEPSLGLAPLIVREIFDIIADLRRTGVSILLVEQNARAALHVADYAYVMETGEIVLEGPARSLASDPKVIETYLGLSTAGGRR